MSSELADRIREFDTPYLLEQFYLNRAEYGDEALAVMEKEIASRDIPEKDLRAYTEQISGSASGAGGQLSRSDFVTFGDTFSHTDLILVHAILSDAQVPFFVDNPPASSVLPLVGETTERYTIRVLGECAEKAHEVLDQHYHRVEGEYRLRHTGTRDRLRSFSFHEIGLTDAQLEEEVSVTLSLSETQSITRYGRRLLEEADSIEQQGDRVIFYYDNVKPLLERLASPGGKQLRTVDLLTIIEILQLYCDSPGFPENLEAAAGPLIDVFG